jgi:hypothetical protein
MKLFRILVLLPVLFSFGLNSNAQNSTQQKDTLKYVQLTGIVVSDSMKRLPYTAVFDTHTKRGVICDFFGYFAFVVHPGDTLQFSFIGFKPKYFIVPEPDSTNSLSIVTMLESDSLMSNVVNVYPWPSKEEFADAFVNLEIDDDAIKRAKSHLSPQEMAFVYSTLGSDPSLAYKYQSYQILNQVYYKNQYAPNNLLNPAAWSKFLKSVNNGDLKIMH